MTGRSDPLFVRIYRRLLVLLPRAFRRERGDAMVAMLAEDWRRQGTVGRVRLVVSTTADLVWTALAERIRPTGRRAEGMRTGVGTRASAGTPASAGPPISLLDLKLGMRMLVRYPGLTVAGGLAMAFAICLGAAGYELVRQAVRPTLPLPEGERVVMLKYHDVAEDRRRDPTLLDVDRWRASLRGVEDIGAFRFDLRNIIGPDGLGYPVHVNEMHAAGFRVTGVPAALGRYLTDADEEPGAPDVVVLGHEVWRTVFGADSAVVGRSIRLDGRDTEIVGVMPEGYAFPLWPGLWAPLRVDELGDLPRESVAVRVFGRLASGVDVEQAQAELATLEARATADAAAEREHLRPVLGPYASTLLDLSTIIRVVASASNVFLVILLLVVCGNVALLMFARAATRSEELVVRSALGASRGRIVGQLFAEAAVLGALAAVAGLAGAGRVLEWGLGLAKAEFMNGNEYPFWIRSTLSTETVLYAVGLTLLAAVVAGVLPGLQITGKGLAEKLRSQGGGGGGLRIGGVWTAVIVAQAALTMIVPVSGFLVSDAAQRIRSVEVGFQEEAFLSARLGVDGTWAAGLDEPAALDTAEVAERLAALERSVESDPAVVAATFADRLPRMYHPWSRIELDGGGTEPADSVLGLRAGYASIAVDYFDALGVELLQGRTFRDSDIDSDAPVVIVNESFVDTILGGRNAIGRRFRIVDSDYWNGERPEERPWHEIVGVAPDLGTVHGTRLVGFYHPVRPEAAAPLHLAVHLRGDPTAFTTRLREIVSDTDPRLRLYDPLPIPELNAGELDFLRFWVLLIAGVSLVTMVLALTGIYAIMSFAVSRRTREIGVRVALGANARRVAAATFKRPMIQVGSGIAIGAVVTAVAVTGYAGGIVTPRGAVAYVGYALAVLAVCGIACIVPTKRALSIEPTEALRADG